MFAKIEPHLPSSWIYHWLVFVMVGCLMFPAKVSFFLGFGAILLSSLGAQLLLRFPFPVVGVQRHWLQLISAQACKWFVFSIIMYITVSYKLIDEMLFFGVIVSQLIVFWNYRKYG